MARVHAGWALSLAQSGKTQEAIAAMRLAVQADPSSPAAHNDLGVYLQRGGGLREAVAEYLEALRLDPGFTPAADNLRVAEESSAAASGSVHPGWKRHLNMGFFLIRKGRLDEAIREARLAVKGNPASPEAHNNLGFYLQRKGRLKEAAAEYREALRLDPGFALAANNFRAAEAQLAAGGGGERR